jgi:hypothetical protein
MRRVSSIILSLFQRLTKLLMVSALAFSLGLHWALLQSLAWTTMLVENLANTSFSAALQRTFDGKHPCRLCLLIAQGKSGEKKAEFPAPLRKLEFVSQIVALAFFPPSRFELLSSADDTAESLALAPPTPPPKSQSVSV